MKQKAFVLQNKGMKRDLSISKAGESSAYENHNIRILARDHDTLLSVTNERGNKEVELPEEIQGELLGWNVLNNHIILFTHEEPHRDRIYRIDYYPNGTEEDPNIYFISNLLFDADLGLSLENPIESVVYHETDEIQKIYWVDGIHVLRFMNFWEQPDEHGHYSWQDQYGNYDNTYFDSNRQVDFGVKVEITKDNSGNTRPNGVIQYLLTYYNKHGQESGYVWISDLVYLSPVASGGAADGTNSNSVRLTVSNLDTRFSHFRVYSVFRSSLNGKTISYIVWDGETTADDVIVVDNNGTNLVSVDSSQLLFLGSQPVKAGTLAHKDQTLFLGDLNSVGRNYDDIEKAIRDSMFKSNGWESDKITFRYSDDNDPSGLISNIKYVGESGQYPYENQLNETSSNITTFKGGEKYRFGLMFHREDGSTTDAFWIGDATNTKYPIIDVNNEVIKRVVVECEITNEVLDAMDRNGFKTVQLMIAEATYADRSVKAQGIINPTVFNVWDRYNNRLYAAASWIARPKQMLGGGPEPNGVADGYAWRHFEPTHRSTSSTGEIQCSYWHKSESGSNTPEPGYVMKDYTTNPSYIETFDGEPTCDYFMVIYELVCNSWGLTKYSVRAWIAKGNVYSGASSSSLFSFQFTDQFLNSLEPSPKDFLYKGRYDDPSGNFSIDMYSTLMLQGEQTGNNSKTSSWTQISSLLKGLKSLMIPPECIVTEQVYYQWCNVVSASGSRGDRFFFNYKDPDTHYDESHKLDAFNVGGAGWYSGTRNVPIGSYDYIPAYYKKHLMFVDENAITLNSPEIEYEAVSFDNAEDYKLRIVGVAKVTSSISDYTVYASPGKLPGENLVKERFIGTSTSGSLSGLTSWPLWEEYGLMEKREGDSGEEDYILPDIEDRTSENYMWGGSFVKYWLHMWNHSGLITAFDDGENEYSRLHNKTFANQKFCYSTIYNHDRSKDKIYELGRSLRIFNYTSSQYVGLKVGDDTRYYDGIVSESLSMPGDLKYPVLYTIGEADSSTEITSENAYLYITDPVQITYASNPHAIMSLPTTYDAAHSKYVQTILPKMSVAEGVYFTPRTPTYTGVLMPWLDNTNGAFKDYDVDQEYFVLDRDSEADRVGVGDHYFFIGEIYYDFAAQATDTRYGGTDETAIESNRFMVAGPQYRREDLSTNHIIYGNQGDTYFQRWDCLKTKPFSTSAVNNNIDITSVMLETHINIDGRTDLQRGTSYIASIDTEKFGSLNRVYSQNNNFLLSRDLDEDFNLDAYRSSITWTLEKHDSADVDEWSHITLASTLKLDGDKGICQALRRFNNTIIAFQDRAISEILFNSRTQLTTTDGVPVEIANSGKVDGKRYISNKFGCVNKWSIVEGKSALYFVDNINKAFCAFGGQGIQPLSDTLGFGTWFKRNNSMSSWTPVEFENIVSFYDRVHSDVYLVKKNDSENQPCLVYNEALGTFTSFFDYASVPMMTNVEDKFLSFRDGHLWKQNEGLYCNFFGEQYDYWTQYRVTPDPYLDKIWTNIDYRADFYEVLDENGETDIPEEALICGEPNEELTDQYKEWETFTTYKVWDEYQTTGDVPFTHEHFDRDDVRKKFRIWRLAIPRALKEGTNRHGMDRIRNPWINLLFKKENSDGKNLMQLHDIVVKYFE